MEANGKKKLPFLAKFFIGLGAFMGGLILLLSFVEAPDVTYKVQAPQPGSGYAGMTPNPTPEETPAPPSRLIDLEAAVKYEDGYVWIKNKNDFIWGGLEMSINPGVFGGGYKCERHALPPGEFIKIPVGEFADSDSNRFNILAKKIDKFLITANTPDGRKMWSGEWSNP